MSNEGRSNNDPLNPLEGSTSSSSIMIHSNKSYAAEVNQVDKVLSGISEPSTMITAVNNNGEFPLIDATSRISSLTCHFLMSDPENISQKAWHEDCHKQFRSHTIDLILRFIIQRRNFQNNNQMSHLNKSSTTLPTLPRDWNRRATELAKRLEKRLYLSANSFEE